MIFWVLSQWFVLIDSMECKLLSPLCWQFIFLMSFLFYISLSKDETHNLVNQLDRSIRSNKGLLERNLEDFSVDEAISINALHVNKDEILIRIQYPVFWCSCLHLLFAIKNYWNHPGRRYTRLRFEVKVGVVCWWRSTSTDVKLHKLK